jgi:DNA-directed RNA polymerase sigma subunit (sigma70/sigma32)
MMTPGDAIDWFEKFAAAKKAKAKTPAVSSPKPIEVKAPTPKTPKPLKVPKVSETPPVVAPGQKQPIRMSEAEKASRKAKEAELHRIWKESGYKPELALPLLKSVRNFIDARNRIFSTADVPKASLNFEHEQRAIEALKKWDPNKSQLSTWLNNHLRKGGRFVLTNQNFARITENIAQHIPKFNAKKAELTEMLGHEPDAHMLAQHTGLSLKDVKRLNKEQRKGFIASGDSLNDFSPPANLSSRTKEVINLIHHELTPQERLVHEYLHGLHGKPVIRETGKLAKVLGWDDSKVSKLKRSSYEKMEKYLE